MKLFPALMLFISVCSFAQEGITVTAGRSVTLAADETDVSLGVLTNSGTTQDQVVQALQSAGVTAQNLIGISSAASYYNPQQPSTSTQLVYQFAFAVPYAKTKDTIDKLDAARKTFQANGGDMQYNLQISASQTAIDAARQQAIPDLIAQAKKRADFLATAVQLKLGAIATINDYASGASTYIPTFFGTSGSYSSSGNPSGINITFSVNIRFNVQ